MKCTPLPNLVSRHRGQALASFRFFLKIGHAILISIRHEVRLAELTSFPIRPEKHKENFEDTAIWGPLKERIALYVLLELGLVRDYAEKRKLINPVMPGRELFCQQNVVDTT